MHKTAVHESATSEKVIRFESIEIFTEDFQRAYYNRKIYGVFEKDGELKATDTYGHVHEDIVKQ